MDELTRILAAGDVQWTDYPVVFDSSGVSVYGPERLALFGIDLPAGITEWDPMAGYGSRIRLPNGAACWIDVRTRVPKPAASRLFVDSAEGARIGIPLHRALLRFGLKRVQEENDELWYDWFDEILREISYDMDDGYWTQVVRMERALIREVLSHKVVVADGDDMSHQTLEKLRNVWGQWVPIRSFGVVEKAVGLWPTGRNRFILFGHPTRLNGDIKEVDIDNYIGEPFDWN